MQDGNAPTSAKVKPILYLSTMALLRQALWIQRSVAVIHKDMLLVDAIQDGMVEDDKHALTLPLKPCKEDIQSLVEDLVPKASSTTMTVGMAHPVFHAGQDWLLAGDSKEVAILYSSFLSLFRQWARLSDENREHIAVLVHSQGSNNSFPNHLLC